MRRTIASFLLSAVAAFTGMAGNVWSIQGTEYTVDTLFHNQIGPGTTQTSLWFRNATTLDALRVFYTTMDMTNPYLSLRGVCATDKLAGNEKISGMAERKSKPGARYMVREAVRALDIPVEAHFHNDLGLGTANALAAAEAGASALHTTILGLGPRAGQGATEQVAIALKLLYNYDTGIKLDKLYDLGLETAKLARVHVPGNQPVVGDLIYLIEAGMPATWWPNVEKEHPLSLYGILPSVMGQPPVKIVLGKGSGTASIRYWLDKLNLTTRSEDDVHAILTQVKEMGLAKKRGLTEEEFVAIVQKYL